MQPCPESQLAAAVISPLRSEFLSLQAQSGCDRPLEVSLGYIFASPYPASSQ